MAGMVPTAASLAASSINPIAFEALVGDRALFLRDYWNRRPKVTSGDPERLSEILSLTDLDDLLARRNLREPYIRVANEGRPLHEKRFLRPLSVQGVALRGVADVTKLAREFSSGATLLFDSIDHYNLPVKRLCDMFHAELHGPAEAVAFVTPPSRQGLTVHYDNTEVFVLQLYGRKVWRVYDQVRPLVGEGKVLAGEKLGSPVLETCLSPGDCMYLPWGSPHYATSEEALSCHLSIMVRPPTWADVLHKLVKAATTETTFDPVPLGLEGDLQALTSTAAQHMENAVTRLSGFNTRSFAEAYRQQLNPTTSPRAGFLQQGMKCESLKQSTLLRRNRLVPCLVTQGEMDSVTLEVDGRVYAFPSRARRTLEAATAFDEGTLGSLRQDLNEVQTTQIAIHLVENGILTIL